MNLLLILPSALYVLLKIISAKFPAREAAWMTRGRSKNSARADALTRSSGSEAVRCEVATARKRACAMKKKHLRSSLLQYSQRLLLRETADSFSEKSGESIRKIHADLVFLQEVQGEHEGHRASVKDWPENSQFEFLADEDLAALCLWKKCRLRRRPSRQRDSEQISDSCFRKISTFRRIASKAGDCFTSRSRSLTRNIQFTGSVFILDFAKAIADIKCGGSASESSRMCLIASR